MLSSLDLSMMTLQQFEYHTSNAREQVACYCYVNKPRLLFWARRLRRVRHWRRQLQLIHHSPFPYRGYCLLAVGQDVQVEEFRRWNVVIFLGSDDVDCSQYSGPKDFAKSIQGVVSGDPAQRNSSGKASGNSVTNKAPCSYIILRVFQVPLYG